MRPRSTLSTVSRGRLGRLAVVVVAVVFAAGCGGTRNGGSEDTAPRTVHVESLTAVPVRTTEDWVSYGDAVVVAHVIESVEVAPTDEEVETGGGMIDRMVTFAVEEVLWQREGGPEAPDTFTDGQLGWVFDETGRARIESDAMAWVESGKRYLMPLAVWADGEWGSLTSIELTDGGVPALDAPQRAEVAGEPDDVPEGAVEMLAGGTLDGVAAELEATEPDPTAAANFHLDPIARSEAVAETMPVGEPAEGEF